jgi:electron transport complex protein RnfG
MATTMTSMMNRQSVMTKEDGMYVVNTTTLAKDVRGFKGNTPLKIYIKKNKIDHIEALNNRETPQYFARAKKGLFAKWTGMKVAKAAKGDVDGVTGATFTSKALKENVKRGVKYYLDNK